MAVRTQETSTKAQSEVVVRRSAAPEAAYTGNNCKYPLPLTMSKRKLRRASNLRSTKR